MYNYTLNLAQNMITSLMLCFKSAFRIRFRMDLVFFADPDPKLKTRIRICPLTNQWDLNDVVDQVFDFPDRIRIFGRSGSVLRKKSSIRIRKKTAQETLIKMAFSRRYR